MNERSTESGDRGERTTLRLLSQTPLRDLVRGRITGRLDVDAIIADASLPSELAAMVRRVVKKTRLWRIEKADVARELTAHMRDAHASGKSQAQTLAEFGEAAVAARLIRRAKKRSRPVAWHIMKWSARATGIAFLACIAAYLLIAIPFWTAEPRPTRDYVAALNEAASVVPQAERGWPVYRKAIIRLEKRDQDLSDVRSSHDPKWLQMRAYLARNQDAIAMLRQAGTMQALGYVAIPGVHDEDEALLDPSTVRDPTGIPSLNLLLPHLGPLRTAARALAADAIRAAEDGDGDAVTADVRAMFGIARHCNESPTTINQLVSVSVLAMACDTIGAIMADRPGAVPGVALDMWSRELAGFGEPRIMPSLDSERWMFADVVQHLYSDDGHGDGRLASSRTGVLPFSALGIGTPSQSGAESAFVSLLGPIISSVSAGRADLIAEHDRIMAGAEADLQRSLWQRRASSFDREMKAMTKSFVPKTRYALIYILMPALDRFLTNFELMTEQRDAAQVVIALERYRRVHGEWPDSLDRLVPEFLRNVPPDRFDGNPLRYRTVHASPILYSIGADGDDDGGVPPKDEEGVPQNERAMKWRPPGGTARSNSDRGRQLAESAAARRARAESADGDWILWPPVIAPPATDSDDSK